MSIRKEEMITLPKKDLVDMHRRLVYAKNSFVKYDQDQLIMANQAIFDMRTILEREINYLWNKGCHY